MVFWTPDKLTTDFMGFKILYDRGTCYTPKCHVKSSDDNLTWIEGCHKHSLAIEGAVKRKITQQ